MLEIEYANLDERELMEVSNSRVFGWVNRLKWVITAALAAAIALDWLELPGRGAYMYQAVSLTTSCLVPVIVVLTILSLVEAEDAEGASVTMVRYYGYALAVQLTGYTLVAVMNFWQAQGWPLPLLRKHPTRTGIIREMWLSLVELLADLSGYYEQK